MGMQNAHIRDAYALCEFAALLQREIADLGNVDDWTEISAAAKLAELRAESDGVKKEGGAAGGAAGGDAAGGKNPIMRINEIAMTHGLCVEWEMVSEQVRGCKDGLK